MVFHLEGFIANLSVQRQFFPTDEDETGAAKALMRLQDTYKLDTDKISRGELPGNLSRLSIYPGYACPMCVLLVAGQGWSHHRLVISTLRCTITSG